MSKIPNGAVFHRGLVKRVTMSGNGPVPWPPGPWDDEPDKITWDYSKDLGCEIVRNTTGNLCGYVVIHSSHGMHPSRTTLGWDYNNYYDISVHGGWTYSDGRQMTTADVMKSSMAGEDAKQPDFVLGFDCAHLGDLVPGMIAINQMFSGPSFRDDGSYKTIDYVCDEIHSACVALDKLARGEEL